ncbi:MAG TPA: hypothetical protein VJ258_03180 [Candidatus Limnocylindrales bacterium]|nr:hypothetical protein [Candidatus Limnocylindrales bacterium]
MNASAAHLPLPVARLAGALILSLLVMACSAAGATTPPGAPSSPDGSPAPGSSVSGFYLRASQSQALAAQYTFGWLPLATIAEGKFYDGMIAIPTIYPGPLYVGLSYQTISSKGIDEVVAEARTDGLLGTKTDFLEQPMPGSVTCHVQLIVDGVTHDLTGQCGSTDAQNAAAPGSSGAFAAFWNKLTSLSAWLGPELGSSVAYVPSRLAVLVTPPVVLQDSPIAPNQKPWPLAAPFASFGSPMGSADVRCAVLSGADLATLLPAVQAGNQLTRFVDSQAVERSLQARVLLPGEADPC